MTKRDKRFGLSGLALAAAVAAAGFSTPSHACSSEPYMASICVMAWPRNSSFGGGTYVPANGQLMPVSSYTALFSLLGTTYGGDGRTNFQLPDLRGRTIVGAGQYGGTGGPITYNYGQVGGTPNVTLTTLQMPAHMHTLGTGSGRVTVASTLGNMAATTTLAGLSASTTMSGVTATAAGAGLTLNGSTGGNLGTNPSGSSLGTYAGTVRIYSDAAPTVAMKAGSISGNATVTFTGNPTTTISGTPSTSLSGAPAVTVGGNTDVTGASQPVSIMQPYLAMQYYIAAQGLYPTPD